MRLGKERPTAQVEDKGWGEEDGTKVNKGGSNPFIKASCGGPLCLEGGSGMTDCSWRGLLCWEIFSPTLGLPKPNFAFARKSPSSSESSRA
jgi:hypothetical protein